MKNVCLIFLLLIAGCTTALWAPSYEEQWVNGFYVNRDTGQLFVTTRTDAFLFPDEGDFGEALLLSREYTFYPTFGDFELTKENRVKGRVTLSLIEPNPSQSLVTKLKELGFERTGGTNDLELSEVIEGKRYKVEGELPLEKLDKEYRIRVAQPSTFTETAGKIIATPAAITIDAVVTVPSVFLLVAIMSTDHP